MSKVKIKLNTKKEAYVFLNDAIILLQILLQQKQEKCYVKN